MKAAKLGANTFPDFLVEPAAVESVGAERRRRSRLFQRAREKHDLTPLVIHDNYLINLASVHENVRALSIEAFRGELERAIAIGAEYLVAHPGNYKGQTVEQGILHFLEGVAAAARGLKFGKLMLLVENTVGAGAQLGGRFEELHVIREYGAQDDRSADRVLSRHLPPAGIGSRRFDRGGTEEDRRGSGPHSGARPRARDSCQRFEGRARVAHRPARQHRRRLYWIRRVSSHSRPSEAP